MLAPGIRLVRRAAVWCGLLLAGGVLGAEAIRYLGLDAYLDHIEGNIAIGAWDYWAHGTPLYALQDGAPRFANIYGPVAYLAQVSALALAGPSVLASKLTSLGALLAALVLLGLRLWRERTASSLNAAYFFVATLVAFSPWSFWSRADALEVLAVAVALFAGGGPLATGICIGVAVNLKAHAFVYFLPIVFDLWRRRGWRPLVGLTVVAFAVCLLPFALPGVLLGDYLRTVEQQVAGRHHAVEHLVGWLIFLGGLILPLAVPLMQRDVPAEARGYAWACFASLALLVYVATFPGAGFYHLLPFAPVLAEARRRLPAGSFGGELAVFPLLLVAWVTAGGTFRLMTERASWGVRADEAATLARAQQPPAEIGYGDNQRSYEQMELAKAKLAFAGSPPLVDGQILGELQQIGIDGSQRWVPYVAQCEVPRWVLPCDEQPFAARAYFYKGGPVFDDAFRAAFAANYRVARTSAHFALWECRDASG